MQPIDLQLNLSVLLPVFSLVIFAMVVMVVDMFASDDRPGVRRALPWVSLAAVIVTGAITAWQWGQPTSTFQGMATNDHFALALDFIVLIAAALGILLSVNYIPTISRQLGEYYALLLLATAGMMMMGTATDLISVFMALEIFSLALYILSGLYRSNPRSTEASL